MADHHSRSIVIRAAQKQKPAALTAGFYIEKVARLAGFEPTTPWFVAKYSIQLSYSRARIKL